MNFEELAFQPELLESIKAQNFVECTPIQAEAMPLIVDGKDVAGLAQTGTGKTAAFLLPLMDRILKSGQELEKPERAFSEWKKNQFVLVLVPTRELAEQVYDNFNKLSGNSPLRGVSVYGGVSYDKQKKLISEGVEFVIATPGRLIDLYKEHVVDLRQVRAIVFDEADRMFDMGFKDDMKYILSRVPRERQFIVFSATLNFDVLNVAYQFGSDPIECNVSRDQAKAENVEDEIFHVGHDEKPKYLLSVVKKHEPKQAIIFSNFKMNVGRIAKFLTDNGFPAVGISSLLTQAQRNRVMEQFKGSSDRNILVATDVAARGLDIKGVDLVVNFELPDDPENYVHRIGRTGRAGATGKAFSVVSDRDVDALARIEEYLKNKLSIGWMEDADLVEEMKEFPRESKETRRPRSGSRDGRDRNQRSGNKRRDSKPRRDRDRDRNRDRGRDEQRARGEKEEGAESASTHRDRKTGRHKTKSKTNRRKNPKKAVKGGRRREDKALSNSNKKRRPRRRPTSSKPAPKTMGQKIGGFFKKLFS